MTPLYIDTATAGMPNFKLRPEDPAQPRMCRLAASSEESAWGCLLIRGCGPIDPGASRAHRVTTELCERLGTDIEGALDFLEGILPQHSPIVAYNMDFHRRVLIGELIRSGRDPALINDRTDLRCAMREATPIVKRPSMAPGGGWAWPKMEAAYYHFTGKDFHPEDMSGPLDHSRYMVDALRQIWEGIERANSSIGEIR